MTKNIDTVEELLHLYKVKNGFAISKNGSITAGYKINLPPVHSVGKSDIAKTEQSEAGMDIYNSLLYAIKDLPDNFIYHQQDFIFDDVTIEIPNTYDFLNAATRRMYHDRKILNQVSYIFITSKNASFKSDNFQSMVIKEFTENVDNFASKMNIINPVLMTDEDWQFYLESYFSLNFGNIENKNLLDFDFQKGVAGGEYKIQGYTVNGDRCIKGLHAYIQNYERSSPSTARYNGWVFPIIFGVDTPKVVNNIIYKYPKKNIKTQISNFESRLSLFGKLLPEGVKSAQEMKTLMEDDNFLPIYHHYNVIFFIKNHDITRVENIESRIRKAFATMGIVPQKITIDLADVLIGSVGGCTEQFTFPIHTYPCFADEALCFSNFEGQAAQNKNGIVFADHYGSPVVKDLYFEPYQKGIITNWNANIIGPSGTGKSVLTNYIISSMYAQDFFFVIIDIGNSYQTLCTLMGGKYLRVDTEKDGMSMNPFLMPMLDPTDNDVVIALREEYSAIRSILFTAWTTSETDEENPTAALLDNPNSRQILANLIIDFYKWRFDNKTEYVNFDNFYDFVEKKHNNKEIKTSFFNADSFLLIMDKYRTGKELGFLFNGKDNINDFANYKMIVFELGDVQNDKLLFRLISSIIMMLTNNIVERAEGKLRQIWIDECWRMLEDPRFGVFIKMLSKTIRKKGGGITVIVQELGDILRSEHGEAIINNAGTFMALSHEGKEMQISKHQSQLNLTTEELSLLLSMKLKDRMVFIKQGGYSGIYKIQISPEHYACFTSTKEEKELMLTLIKQHNNSITKAINEFVEKRK